MYTILIGKMEDLAQLIPLMMSTYYWQMMDMYNNTSYIPYRIAKIFRGWKFSLILQFYPREWKF